MGSQTFNYTGGWQKFNVPTDVEWLTIDMDGAGTVSARRGGHVKGRVKVKDTDVLYVAVGGRGLANDGRTGGKGGWPNGGDGGNGLNSNGGDGGGGASFIRLNRTDGQVVCVAGGCGGASGDGGNVGTGDDLGGRGGALTGESGKRGSAGYNSTGQATGGTQTQGGEGGTSSSGAYLGGKDAQDSVLGQAGDGGSTGGYYGPGGGGGGGGFRSGGGGQAGSTGYAPGGGGAGGSNFVGNLDVTIANERGTGSLSHGSVVLTWDNPPPANQPPSAPTNIKVAGKDAADGLVTSSTGTVIVKANVSDPNKEKTRIVVRIYDSKGKSAHDPVYSDYEVTGKATETGNGVTSVNAVATARITGLSQNSRYYLRIYAQDIRGLTSNNYASTNFWTNRSPGEPRLNLPAAFATFDSLTPIQFTWAHIDPDQNPLKESEIRYRQMGVGADWTVKGVNGTQALYVSTVNPPQFKSNRFYEWSARTRDSQGLWGPWAASRQFYISGTTTPPRLISPTDDPVRADQPSVFKWKFVDPDPGDSQIKADLRYRVQGTGDDGWFTLFGNTYTPGSAHQWTIPANTFQVGYSYEWQVRTYDMLSATGQASDWTDSATFSANATPGLKATVELVPRGEMARGTLGQGAHRVYIYERGGQKRVAELTNVVSGQWSRVRDDISAATVNIDVDTDNRGVLGYLRSWLHEVVIYRDAQRVWEGPITRIGYKVDSVEIEAHDIMAWVYRRIMRRGYNDSGTAKRSVVERAALLVEQALSPDDPNILPYLTTFQYADDAKEARVREAFASTAWEEIDDLAATAGLDYTVAGRRILLWDTHRKIGKLPQMDDQHFADPPIVTEYGMTGCTAFGVTNNAGLYGYATGVGLGDDPDVPSSGIEKQYGYGRIELLASAYGDTASATTGTLTAHQRSVIRNTMDSQAKRNIGRRWPMPLVVRVPDNTTLAPSCPVDIQWLIPGVWIPLQARRTIRQVRQWQKLDNLTVNWDSAGEQVHVTMSPAPIGHEDPDADVAATAAANG